MPHQLVRDPRIPFICGHFFDNVWRFEFYVFFSVENKGTILMQILRFIFRKVIQKLLFVEGYLLPAISAPLHRPLLPNIISPKHFQANVNLLNEY